MLRYCIFVLALSAISSAIPNGASADITVAYDFVGHYADAKVVNALNPGAGTSTAGGVRKRSLFLHPTSGETTATYTVALPKVGKAERLVLMFSAGLRDSLKTDDPENPFDGVSFALRLDGEKQFDAALRETKWVDGAVDLTSKAGRRIEVVFVTSPNENSNYDWAAWGEPRILKLSKGLLGSSNKAKTMKGLVVVDWILGGTAVDLVPLDGSGNPLSQGVKWTPQPTGSKPPHVAVIPFDFTDVKASAVELHFTASISGIEAYKFDPELKIVSFGPSNALLFADTPTEFRCVVKNAGEGVLDSGATAELSVGHIPDPGIPNPTPAQVSSQAPKALGTIMPGEEKVISWQGIQVPAGGLAVSVTIEQESAAKLSANWWGAASNVPVSLPSRVEGAECKRLSDGTIVLQNPGFRMMFLNGEVGYTGWMIGIPKGDDWQPVASGAPLGKVVVAGKAGSEPVTYQLYPKDLKIVSEAGRPPLIFFVTTKQIGSSECQFEWIFELDPSDSRVSVSQQMTADQPVRLLHFSGPMVYAGDRGFGSAKDEGLFPGLEYLLSESSSGTENAHPPHNLRTVPHPNKVTIPLMAVRSGDTLVALEWDPLQKWDGTADRAATVFASPNFLDSQDNHKMGLFAPSVPDWTPENKQIAEKAYVLEAGKSIELKADIVVKPDSKTILDAVDGWLAGHGVPDPPKLDKKSYEILDLCDSACFSSAWDDAAKAWKHTNTGPVSFDSMIATYMWAHANYLLQMPDKRQKFMDVIQPAVEKAKDRLPLDISLHAGGVEAALNRMAEQVNGLMAAQREDGSWPFTPDEKHEVFGKPGDSSSGWSANYAGQVLQYAAITGDAKAREAGLKALKYLDTQTRPEGAQTWELQLHVPDILASARLINAYLYGYQLTDDRKYLDRAVYWGKSGLPFVYLWNAADRPIMRYGTIPVFGVTWFDLQPWFGVCVQWCGLDYAYSISRLSDFDDSLPWAKIAEGILNCGVQQQEYITEKYPADSGMYPDAYSPIKGEEEYHWDLNPRLISRQIMRQYGADPFPYTYIVTDSRGQKLALTLPCQGVKLTYEKEWLRARIPAPPLATIHAILSGVYSPTTVGLNTNVIPPVRDVENVEKGCQYFPDKVVTIIKLRTEAVSNFEVDLLEHEMRAIPEATVQ